MLDEATSALDGESERVIKNALGSKKWGRQSVPLCKTTQITVAHRLSTVISSYVIVVMDKGKVVKMENHTNLIATTHGAYSKLFPTKARMEG